MHNISNEPYNILKFKYQSDRLMFTFSTLQSNRFTIFLYSLQNPNCLFQSFAQNSIILVQCHISILGNETVVTLLLLLIIFYSSNPSKTFSSDFPSYQRNTLNKVRLTLWHSLCVLNISSCHKADSLYIPQSA